MFRFLFGFLTKFLLHFIDIHRYVSPANEIDYLLHPKFPKAKGLCRWGILLLLLPIAWTALPSSDYYALSATFSGHWLFGERLPLSYFPSALTFLGKLPVFNK
jgi:hypothetical protein